MIPMSRIFLSFKVHLSICAVDYFFVYLALSWMGGTKLRSAPTAAVLAVLLLIE